MEKTIDARGQACPKPLVMARDTLKTLTQDDKLNVVVDNLVSAQNLEKMASQMNLPSQKVQQGTDEEQQNSIIYYESTYMPNYAVAYGGAKNFEVISVLDGTVLSIKKDDLLGNVVEIKHDNELISVYQSLADITVKENQVVKQGDVIGKAGTSNINKDLNEHLLFEMLYKGQIVNPEEYYNKNISEL